jgi:hypothetical protein
VLSTARIFRFIFRLEAWVTRDGPRKEAKLSYADMTEKGLQ